MAYKNELLEQPSQVSPLWRAALYIRLSKEDGDKQESYSVTSQREILTEYIKQHPEIDIYDIYVDDGWSGTNFERPAFQRMMDDINELKVNCVVVKDLSRFGRNYTDAGYYIDNVFVKMRVRFIALNNGVDSASNNMNAATQCITVGVQNVINESVAATTSVNIRGTLNVSRKQGKFIGSFPTYGYKKDPENHHQLIIDEEAAEVVRLIFKLYLAGKSVTGIVKHLNQQGYPNPTNYKKAQGLKFHHNSVGNDGLWCYSTVRRILSNEMYIGNMVQGKNTTVSYKIKQCVSVPRENWIIVQGTHEPIVSKEDFNLVQSLIVKPTRTAPTKTEVDLFAGLVKCADCKRGMSKKTNTHSYGTYKYYRCVTEKKMDDTACTPHSIRIDKLEYAVLMTIQIMIDNALELKQLTREIESELKGRTKSNHAEKSLVSQRKAFEDKKKEIMDLYPDWKSGILSKDEYLGLKDRYNEELKKIEERIEALVEEVNNEDEILLEENDFITHFLRYGQQIEHLTRPILTELVDSIYVHEDGNITINFKFEDAYAQLVDYLDEFRKTAANQPFKPSPFANRITS